MDDQRALFLATPLRFPEKPSKYPSWRVLVYVYVYIYILYIYINTHNYTHMNTGWWQLTYFFMFTSNFGEDEDEPILI